MQFYDILPFQNRLHIRVFLQWVFQPWWPKTFFLAILKEQAGPYQIGKEEEEKMSGTVIQPTSQSVSQPAWQPASFPASQLPKRTIKELQHSSPCATCTSGNNSWQSGGQFILRRASGCRKKPAIQYKDILRSSLFLMLVGKYPSKNELTIERREGGGGISKQMRNLDL